MCRTDQTLPVAGRTGKGAMLTPKQLACSKALGKRSTIHRHVGVAVASALGMDGTGDEFFAHAGLTEDQDGSGCAGSASNLDVQRVACGTDTEQGARFHPPR